MEQPETTELKATLTLRRDSIFAPMSGPLAPVRAAHSLSRLGARTALFAMPRRAEHDRRQKLDEEVWHAYHPLPHTVRPNTPLWRQLHPLEAAQLDPPEVNPKAFGYEGPAPACASAQYDFGARSISSTHRHCHFCANLRFEQTRGSSTTRCLKLCAPSRIIFSPRTRRGRHVSLVPHV